MKLRISFYHLVSENVGKKICQKNIYPISFQQNLDHHVINDLFLIWSRQKKMLSDNSWIQILFYLLLKGFKFWCDLKRVNTENKNSWLWIISQRSMSWSSFTRRQPILKYFIFHVKKYLLLIDCKFGDYFSCFIWEV